MSVLRRASDAFWDYVSPHKPAARPAAPPSVPGAVKTSHHKEPVGKTPSPPKPVDSVVGSGKKPEKKRKRSSDTVDTGRRFPKIAKTTTHASDDIDGTTFIGDDDDDEIVIKEEEDLDSSTVFEEEYDIYDDRDVAGTIEEDSAEDEIVVGGRSSDVGSYNSSDSESDGPDDTLLDPEETEIETRKKPLDVIAEPQQRKPAAGVFISKNELRQNGWPEDSINFIQRLHQRGFEPLFPLHWQMDFKFLPDELFYRRERGEPYFRSLSGLSDFHATKALHRLLQLGPKVRDKVACGLRPDLIVKTELLNYLLWARRDNITPTDMPDLVVIENGPANAEINTMEQNLLRRLDHLDIHLSDWIPEHINMPSIFGVLVSHTLVGIVLYVPPHHGASATPSKKSPRTTTPGELGSLRSVGVFDFGQQGYDVWNSLALAMLVQHCRDIVGVLEVKMDPAYDSRVEEINNYEGYHDWGEFED